MPWIRLPMAALALALALGAQPAPAAAEDDPACRVVTVDMIPTPDLQIVVWIEDTAGNYVGTAYITRLTGSLGLGNRPGMMEFNTAWRWPYGRRTTTFPVWAHRHGMEWPLVIFQNEDETNLSHPLGQSSVESFYCRPLREGEVAWDTQTCASTIFTDKGVLSGTETSNYPPRSDLSFVEGVDHPSVTQMAGMNPFDLVSRATPVGGEPFQVSWPIPDDLPDGDYVLWVEVGKELDQNQFYDYPEPTGIPWSEYGIAYRGQPSVVWRVPFTIAEGESISHTAEYAGYGDPDGIDGNLREPDNTITTGVSGSGAGRLMLISDQGDQFRVRVAARPAFDEIDPGAPSELIAQEVRHDGVELSFIAPGDDDDLGIVTGYEVRYLAGTELTADNFADATPASARVTPLEPGSIQTLSVNELIPQTNYYIGIRAYDECLNYGPIGIIKVTTPERPYGSVDACFVATAAWGTNMAADVQMLRNFRDVYLRSNVIGEILVEAYYTFGPSVAALIAPSDTARRAARTGLAPLVDSIRGLVP
jgi:hypothetical protein